MNKLSSTFPTFRDHGLYQQDQEVLFLRKAQRLVSDLYESLHEEDDRFQFEDIESISVDSGKVGVGYLSCCPGSSWRSVALQLAGGLSCCNSFVQVVIVVNFNEGL